MRKKLAKALLALATAGGLCVAMAVAAVNGHLWLCGAFGTVLLVLVAGSQDVS